MDDLISRQQAIDAMAELQGRASTKAELKGISKAWKRIKRLPSAQPEPIKYNIEDFNKEDWEQFKKEWRNAPITVLPAQPLTATWGDHFGMFQCSNCGREYMTRHHFCPHCGSRMEREVAD